MNNFPHTLFLASKSLSRQALLKQAGIPFVIIPQNADEQICDFEQPFEMIVRTIARSKMDHAILPPHTHSGEFGFVLTADTLVQDKNGIIHGKPKDYADAVEKLRATREGVRCCTAFCLKKMKWDGSSWKEIKSIEQIVLSSYIFSVPDDQIEGYLHQETLALQAAGAHCIEGLGIMFFQSINGSFSGCLGLPLFELRKRLKELGFFEGG